MPITKPTPVSTAIRQAIEERIAAGETTEAIAEAADVPLDILERFLGGERPDLALQTVDKLASYLQFELRPVEPLKPEAMEVPAAPPPRTSAGIETSGGRGTRG